jgi:hypothetical protein
VQKSATLMSRGKYRPTLGWMRAGRSKVLEFASDLHHSGGASLTDPLLMGDTSWLNRTSRTTPNFFLFSISSCCPFCS